MNRSLAGFPQRMGRLLVLPALLLLTATATTGVIAETVPAMEKTKSTTGFKACHDNDFAHPPLKSGVFRKARLDPPERPAKGAAYRDPEIGVCISRLTDHDNEPPRRFARVSYSRSQPFNADETRILVLDGEGVWHLYDARSLEHIKRLDLGGGSVEPHWHPSDPDVLYLLPNRGGLSLDAYHVGLEKRRQLVDFTDIEGIEGHHEARDIRDIWPDAARIWTRWEGSPSRDARYWAFQVETENEKPLGLIAFDLAEERIVGSFDIRRVGRPDHVSMSPSGKYIVASWPEEAADCPFLRRHGTLEKPCGLMAFTRDFDKAVALSRKSPHSDIAIDASGREVIVIANYESGNVEMIDLASGKTTPLWRIYVDGASTAMHISAKAYQKPGWVLISTYWTKDPDDAQPWYENRLMAVELSADPRILNIANLINKARTYFSEPHATVNRDFTRIVFNANWGSGRDEDVDVYIAWLSPDAIPGRMPGPPAVSSQ